jgi:flavin reductase (DIM6/NTAB) family NADH-FMN oxidoreductase RutF
MGGETMSNKAQRELMEAFNRGIVQGVYIVTVKAGEKISGMTAAWVSKVSHNPPMVMVSISPTHHTHELIKEAGYFALNTLAYGQEEVGRHFGFVSGRDVNKLKDIPLIEGKSGCPILAEAMAYLECELCDTFIAGDHTLFVGKVIGGQVLKSSEIPLVFERADFF